MALVEKLSAAVLTVISLTELGSAITIVPKLNVCTVDMDCARAELDKAISDENIMRVLLKSGFMKYVSCDNIFKFRNKLSVAARHGG